MKKVGPDVSPDPGNVKSCRYGRNNHDQAGNFPNHNPAGILQQP